MTSNNDFYIIALQCTQDDSTGQRKLKSGEPYYFVKGFRIENKTITIENDERSTSNNLYSQYLNSDVSIQISAIVGENGSGKSSIIEYLIRLINNLSAALFGESFLTPASNHLHYIDGIHGELYYMSDGTIYSLSVDGYAVSINRFVKSPIEDFYLIDHVFYITDENNNFGNSIRKKIFPSSLKNEKFKKQILELMGNFFYTLVSNHSIYAYNTYDFSNENTLYALEKAIRKEASEKATIDNSSWLHGLFHKNDGYQVPIVLMPMREQGMIDINNENNLMKERFLSMLFWNGNYSTINGHLSVSHLSGSCKNYDISHFKSKTEMSCNKSGYDFLCKNIIRIWSERLNYDLSETSYKHFYPQAISYLVYKTIKISATYPQYNEFHSKYKHARFKYDSQILYNLINRLYKDKSHITSKLRKTLAYLCYPTYDSIAGEKFNLPIDEARNLVNRAYNTINPLPFINSIDDFLPPPFWDITISLTNKDGKKVNFETLSSGEKQQAYSISSLLYQLRNINSVVQDSNSDRITYKKVLLILEEIELYYHPELQKNLIKNLLDGIRQTSLNHIEAINIIIVTHSPFVLSDVSSDNILLLSNNHQNSSPLKTFGANIHDIMDTGFFMKIGAMGAYSEWLLKKLVTIMSIYQSIELGRSIDFIESKDDNSQSDIINDFFQNKEFNESHFKEAFPKEWVYNTIMKYDEPILQKSLISEYHKIFKDKISREREIRDQIQQLEDELKRINKV